MTITVETLQPEQDEELLMFLNSFTDGSSLVLGYHYPFYRDMLATIGVGEPLNLAARLDGRLVGYLPTFVKQTGEGTVVSSLPFFGPNGGVIAGLVRRAEIHAALLERLIQYASQSNALGCSIYTPFQLENFDLYDKHLVDWTIVDKFTQYQLLGQDHRRPGVGRDLRRAQRLGVQVTCDVTANRVDEFYAIYEQNCRDAGVPLKSHQCVKLLTRPGLLGRGTRLYLALHGNKLLGGLLMIWSPQVASYYIPCTLAESRNLQPSTVLIDAAMSEAQKRGMRYWNWESSPHRDSGVYQFKKKWGAVEGISRVYAQSFAGQDKLRSLGIATIAREFPFFFVWPFDRL